MAPITKALVLAAACLSMSGTALAADMYDAPMGAAPLVPVEVGSGWYLRGDVSYDFKADVDLKFDHDYTNSAGTAFTDHGALDGFDLKENADFSLGFGYQFSDFLRGDLTAHYWQSELKLSSTDFADSACLAFTGGYECSSGNNDAKTWELMANAYVDLGTFAGFTPYVGGGVGAARVKYENLNVDADCIDRTLCSTDTGTDFDGANEWRFAYALTAGLSYDLSQSLKLDIGYRYLNVDGGNVTTGSGQGGAVSFKDDGFDRHTIQAGLRYSLF